MTGSEIREARAKLGGISQKELARRLGVSWVTVSRWERGLSKPHENSLQKVRAGLKGIVGGLDLRNILVVDEAATEALRHFVFTQLGESRR